MHLEKQVDIDAPASVAWAVLSDIPHWPEWTHSVDAVESADVKPLREGASAALALRGAPAADWVVTDVKPGESFTWRARMRGVTSTASHVIEPRPGGCRVTLTIDFSGPGAILFRPVIRRASVRNLEMEAEGLKRRSEELSFAA